MFQIRVRHKRSYWLRQQRNFFEVLNTGCLGHVHVLSGHGVCPIASVGCPASSPEVSASNSISRRTYGMTGICLGFPLVGLDPRSTSSHRTCVAFFLPKSVLEKCSTWCVRRLSWAWRRATCSIDVARRHAHDSLRTHQVEHFSRALFGRKIAMQIL